MKRILALILSIALFGCGVAFANAEQDIELISEEPQELILDKMIVEGIVKSSGENQIDLGEVVLNLDENTLVAGVDLIPTEVKEGDLVTAVVSTMTTRSIPPQNYAFYVIVRKNAEDFAPIFMTVDKVEEGFIYSQDGNYKVSFEDAQVGMYRTKNIVKAEELTKGSEIFVYSNMMTMSIPALVNPTEIVIMNIAEQELDKALALNEEGILLGTENGLELEREVTRAEAVALIQRTTQAERKSYTCDFADVEDSHWAYSYIGWATETNIVKGVGDNKFEPDRTVTAKELAMMLLNAQGEAVEFDKAFETAQTIGLVEEADGIFEEDVLSRDAVAKMIYNYYTK